MTDTPNPDLEALIAARKRWIVREPVPADIATALAAFRPLTRQILYNRGIIDAETAGAYIEARSPANTDPFCILGMAAAVDRIRAAAERGERVAVYGDYDVDGVTATALLVEVLIMQGVQAEAYIPHRFDEGYGLNNEALQALYQSGVRLVISVDCGIRSPAEAEFARELGLDLIISDHHHPAGDLPRALAVINPKQAGCNYPDKNLAGVGLAYKIAQALFATRPVDGCQVEDWLDLVALGTVADLAPLLAENRALVALGLKRIRARKRQGLASLAGAAMFDIEKCTTGDIGFRLGPRLNAAGRIDTRADDVLEAERITALSAYTLLVAKDPFVTGKLAQELEKQNSKRQTLTREIQKEAELIVKSQDPDTFLIFAYSTEFSEGVVGLAASKLVDAYYRPAMIGSYNEAHGTSRFSCRSIPEFHITDALDACADLLVRHGGHKAAAGFTVQNENLPALKARLMEAARVQLSALDLRPALTADMEFPLQSLTTASEPRLWEQLNCLQPTGSENPEPLFVSRGLSVVKPMRVGVDGAHLKFFAVAGGRNFPAIAFRQGNWHAALADGSVDRIDIIYTFEMNDYNGNSSLQLNIKDIRPAGQGD